MHVQDNIADTRRIVTPAGARTFFPYALNSPVVWNEYSNRLELRLAAHEVTPAPQRPRSQSRVKPCDLRDFAAPESRVVPQEQTSG